MCFDEYKDMIFGELENAFDGIDEKQVDQLAQMICDADQVFFVGVGRVLMMLQAFCKRLNHLGISANYVGAVDEPAITDRDLLIVGSGSGESIFPLEITKKAKQFGAKVAHIGANPKSSMTPYEDLFIRIPCSTKLGLPDEIPSSQIMSSLFEQSVLILADTVAMMIVEKKGIDDLHALWRKHANLE